MRKRNLVLAVIFCLSLVICSFFSALLSEDVVADNVSTVFYCQEIDPVNHIGVRIFTPNGGKDFLRIKRTNIYDHNNTYTYKFIKNGDVYEDTNVRFIDIVNNDNTHLYAYTDSGNATPNIDVVLKPIDSLFEKINNDNIEVGDDLIVDLSEASDYNLDNISVIQVNDQSPNNPFKFTVSNDKLTVSDIDWKLGYNRISVAYNDYNYCYDFSVMKSPTISRVTLGDAVLTGDPIDIVTREYDFAFIVSPSSGLKSAGVSINDVTLGNAQVFSSVISTTSSNQSFMVDLSGSNIIVGHELSYSIILTDEFGNSFTFKNGVLVDQDNDDSSYSFKIIPTNDLTVSLESKNAKGKDIAKKNDEFSVCLNSSIAINKIVSSIEGTEDTYDVADESASNGWSYDGEDKYTYSGIITSVDTVRYLDATFSIQYENGTDYYDEYSYSDRIVIYPPISISVKSYGAADTVNKDDSFTVKLNYSSDAPALSIVNFTNSTSNPTITSTNNSSSISGSTATIFVSDILAFCKDSETFSFYMNVQDNAGNTASIPISPGHTYYGDFEVSSKIVLTTSNTNKFTDENDIEYGFVNDGDSLKLEFTSNHTPVYYSIMFKGMGSPVGGYATEDNETGLFTIELNEISKYGLEPGEIVNFTMSLIDNKYEPASFDIDFNNIIYLNDYEVAYNEESFGTDSFLTSEDSIDLTFSASDLENTDRDVKIKSIDLEYTNVSTNQSHFIGCINEEDGTFESVKSKNVSMSVLSDINPLINPDNLKLLVKVTLEDRSGNPAEAIIDTNCYYYRSIDESISKVNISNSHDSSVAKVGDTLTLSFNCTHPLGSKNNVDAAGNRILKGTLNGDAVTFTSSDGLIWTAEFTVSENNKWNDNSGIDLYLELYDESDNEHYVMTNKDVSNPMVYYSPISISNFIFKSDNANADGKLANDDDKITLSFDSTHQLKVENAYIADKKVDFTENVSDGVYSYATTCNVSDLEIEDNNPVSFKFDLNDQAGNETYHLDYESTKISVIYQAPIELSETSIISSNDNDKYLAKDGNYITVEFETTHPVNIVSATVAGNDLTLKSRDNDKMHWSGTYLVTNNIVSDNGKINVKVEVGDDSGNDNVVLSSDDIMYYAPLTVSSATISTDNSNDSTKYAIDGNTVVVSFITNHKIATSSSSFSLAGRSGLSVSEEALSNGSYKYTFSRKIANGELSDLSVVAFDLSVTDIAGNSVVSLNEKSSGVINSITYYSPLTVTTSIESSGSNSNYAKNGDTVTVKATVNHAASATSASLLDKSMGVSGNESTSITLTYTISTAESSMKEGTLSASFNFADVAGNTLSVTEINSGSVIYDRTKPSIDVSNGFSGFSADDITFDISIADSNIDKDKTTVDVNGTIRKIGNGLEADGTTYSTVVKNEEDGTLTVTISAVDLAGNSATPVKYTVTIDKSNPTVTTTTLYSTSNKLFKPGLVVAELFEINEENMSEITCTVSDGSSVYDWDINTPLDTDGKKTISIIAVDKAGNASEQLVFDLYIDGTAPNPILTDKIANKVLSVGTNEFNDPTTIVFSLQDLAYNPDEPDKFTKILITCPDGSVVDILADNSVNSDGEYFYDFNEYGTYTVVLEAEDELGNATGEIKYEINIKEKPLDALKRVFSTEDGEGGTKFNYKKAAIIGGGSVAGIALIATCAVFLIRRKRIR